MHTEACTVPKGDNRESGKLRGGVLGETDLEEASGDETQSRRPPTTTLLKLS